MTRAHIPEDWLVSTIKNCRSGDPRIKSNAWDNLLTTLWPIVLRMAIREQHLRSLRSHSWMIAEDAAAHAFGQLFGSIDKIYDPSGLLSWLGLVVRNYVITQGTQGFYAHTYTTGEYWPFLQFSHQDTAPSLSVASRLRFEIRKLPTEQRRLLYDFYWLEMSQKEIANQRGVTHQAISAQLKRIYRTLREALLKAGYNGEAGATTSSC